MVLKGPKNPKTAQRGLEDGLRKRMSAHERPRRPRWLERALGGPQDLTIAPRRPQRALPQRSPSGLPIGCGSTHSASVAALALDSSPRRRFQKAGDGCDSPEASFIHRLNLLNWMLQHNRHIRTHTHATMGFVADSATLRSPANGCARRRWPNNNPDIRMIA